MLAKKTTSSGCQLWGVKKMESQTIPLLYCHNVWNPENFGFRVILITLGSLYVYVCLAPKKNGISGIMVLIRFWIKAFFFIYYVLFTFFFIISFKQQIVPLHEKSNRRSITNRKHNYSLFFFNRNYNIIFRGENYCLTFF